MLMRQGDQCGQDALQASQTDAACVELNFGLQLLGQ